ncbi:MAG: hypothetical protein KGZ51_07505 [Erysipelothrix sp.]|jgi:hypothetical protein|nr:hypothetical protein [Erysipelothrix sp.]
MTTLLRYIREYQEYILLFITPFAISFAFFVLMAILKKPFKKLRYWHGSLLFVGAGVYFASRLNGLEPTSALFVNRFSFFLIVLAAFVSYSAFAITAHALRKRT